MTEHARVQQARAIPCARGGAALGFELFRLATVTELYEGEWAKRTKSALRGTAMVVLGLVAAVDFGDHLVVHGFLTSLCVLLLFASFLPVRFLDKWEDRWARSYQSSPANED